MESGRCVGLFAGWGFPTIGVCKQTSCITRTSDNHLPPIPLWAGALINRRFCQIKKNHEYQMCKKGRNTIIVTLILNSLRLALTVQPIKAYSSVSYMCTVFTVQSAAPEVSSRDSNPGRVISTSSSLRYAHYCISVYCLLSCLVKSTFYVC